jgi:hypothetical protein
MFRYIYSLVYVFTMFVSIMEYLSFDFLPKRLKQFYKTKINTTILNKIIVHPFVVVFQYVVGNLNNIRRFVRSKIDTTNVVGMYVYSFITFITFVLVTIFVSGIFDILFDFGGKTTQMSITRAAMDGDAALMTFRQDQFKDKSIDLYYRTLSLIGTLIFGVTISFLIKKYLTENHPSKPVKKITTNNLIYIMMFSGCVVFVSSLYFKYMYEFIGNIREFYFNSALFEFQIESLLNVTMVHFAMFAVFVCVYLVRKTFFSQPNKRIKVVDKKIVTISLIMNVVVLCLYHASVHSIYSSIKTGIIS